MNTKIRQGGIRQIKPTQHTVILAFILVGVATAITDFWMHRKAVEQGGWTQESNDGMLQPITPIPQTVQLDDRKVLLGERLYNDVQLSGNNTVSCASCHDLRKGGTDQAKTSTGINGAVGPINAPTTFNSANSFVQFWDGRAQDLTEQAAGPVHNPKEMGSVWPDVVAKLSKDASYGQAFAELYPGGIQQKTICDAIAEFERSLYTPNSRFDRFLNGDVDALTADEKEGWRLFKERGCISCHQGKGIGGNMYQTLGVMDSYFHGRPTTPADNGRYNVTGDEWNRHQFKVPSLRNIEKTAPYLHDGSAKTLEDVLQVMWKDQLGRPISKDESDKIVKFLKTLTGTYRGNSL